MQKQILYVSTLFCTIISYGMKHPIHPIPHIVYNAKNTPYALEAKLTETFGPESNCPKEESEFSHQSPEITRIHSHDYLYNLDQYTSTMLARINNNYYMTLYRNTYSQSLLPPMLDNVHTTFAATEFVLNVNDITQFKPNYAISLANGYSFAGCNQGNSGDVYAPIPIAAAYALEKHKNTVQRILIIDENITQGTIKHYFKDGNGSIFCSESNPELSQLFANKIVFENQIELWDFLHSPHNDKIDLAFYNINIDDFELINGMHPKEAKERERKIMSLLYHFIPTIFILSGDKENHQDATFSLIEYIAEKARKLASFNPPQEITQSYIQPLSDSSLSSDENDQEWEQIKKEVIKTQLEEGIKRIDAFIDYLNNKCPLSSLIQSQKNDSHNESEFSDYEASESSSTQDYEYDETNENPKKIYN